MKNKKAFTLIELILTIILIGILATMTAPFLGTEDEAEKFELTKKKMEKIREAIMGNDSKDAKGERKSFGYFGDFGRLPGSLNVLESEESPTWSFDTSCMIGAGWRGPYYSSDFGDPYSISTDRWGKAFIYSTNPPYIKSYGSDGASGGSSYASDLTVELSTSGLFSTLRGIVKDSFTALNNKNVKVCYPVNGAVSNSTTKTDSSGIFSLASIPFGIRSVAVINTPGIGPLPIVVDSPEEFIPASSLNYMGTLQKIFLDLDSMECTGPKRHSINMISSYESDITLNYVTGYWDTTLSVKLNTIALNSVKQSCGTDPGSTCTVSKSLSIGALSTAPLDLTFSEEMSGQGLTLTMQWTSGGDKDTVNWPLKADCTLPPIAINNVQSTKQDAGGTSITLSYTAPSNVGKNLVLVVVGCGEHATSKSPNPTSATFGGVSMTEIATYGTTQNNANNTGMGMYQLSVTPGQSGDITVTWGSTMTELLISALTLSDADPGTPERIETARNNSGSTTDNITTQASFSMVISGGCSISTSSLGVVGTNHTLIQAQETDGAAMAIGNIGPVAVPSKQSNIGFSPSSRMCQILASFPPL